MSGPGALLPEGPTRPGAAGQDSAAAQIRQAMAALRGGDADLAFLIADRLCRDRTTGRTTQCFLLRAAALAKLGDRQAAADDLATAAHINPSCPATNRALLHSADTAQRRAAERRLLMGENPDDRAAALDALAADGFDCVIVGRQNGEGFELDTAWAGPGPLTIEIRPDVGPAETKVLPAERTTSAGLQSSARLAFDAPPDATAVQVTAPGRKALSEPSTLLVQTPVHMATTPGLEHAQGAGALLVIVPVYGDLAATRTCLDSLIAAHPSRRSCRIVAVDDCSPDPAITAYLQSLAAEGTIEVVRNPFNLGFAASVNRALDLRAPGTDVLLLNADTVLPRGVIDKLAAHLDRAPDIGTVTPLSNNGEDTSIPRRFEVNPLPSPAEIERIDAAAGRVSPGQTVELPNGVGFCLYIRGELLDRIGPLSTEFGRGYYEDVEFCLRAAAAGYRNVAALDAFVGHHGGRSFAGEKRALVAANRRRLASRFPDFQGRARRFERDDPLRPALTRIEEALLVAGPPLDLLVMAWEVPESLSHMIAASVAERDAALVVVRAHVDRGQLRLAFTAQDGSYPQSLTWTCEENAPSAVQQLRDRLSRVPVRRLMLVDADTLPATLHAAMYGVFGAAREIATKPVLAPAGTRVSEITATTSAVALRSNSDPGEVACLDYPALPALEILASARRGGVIAIIPQSLTEAEWAFVRSLTEHLRPALSLVVAGEAPPEHAPGLFVSGTIGEDELPNWLARVGASAAFFPSRRWGAADPRVWSWARSGLPTFHFDPGAEIIMDDGGRWAVPLRASPRRVASLVAAEAGVARTRLAG